MPMSRCTKFSLANGKDELSICWDSANGEFEILKQRIAGDPKDEKQKQSICIRTTDLSPRDWVELANAIFESFGKLFVGYQCTDDIDPETAASLGLSFEELQSMLEDIEESRFDDDDDDDDDDDWQ